MRKLFSIFFFLLCPTVFCRSDKPHIITIFVDDLGWNDVGFHGTDQIQTPNIDALAYSGMILNRHYVLPSCTPSRSALMTGSYPIRSGMQGYPLRGGENRSLPLSFEIKPHHLKKLGYKTYLVGKWHLGYETFNHVPNRRGFDTFFGYYNGYVDYYNFTYTQQLDRGSAFFHGYDLHLNDEVFWKKETTFGTSLFTKQAQQIISEHDESQPLYLYMSHLAVHTGTESIMAMQFPSDMNVNKTYSHIKDYGRRAFAGCLEDLDKSIGTLMEALNKKKMLENSIILVMSDNGGHMVSVDMPPNWSSNWPLRGTKFTMHEGGVRGVALVWSPLLPKGVINDEFIHISDWLPTFYSAAGGDVNQLGNVDGISHWNHLKTNSAVRRDKLLVNIDDRTGAEGIIISNRWKVLKGGFPTYGNYDYHWGQESNTGPNPEYDFKKIINSEAGKAIRSIQGYEAIFHPERMEEVRNRLKIKCNAKAPEIPSEDGMVPMSNTPYCKDFCVFDLLNDPCELSRLQDKQDIIQIGRSFLKEYKKSMTFQKRSSVVLESNPKKFGGVWMPWDYNKCLSSIGEKLDESDLNLSTKGLMGYFQFAPDQTGFGHTTQRQN